MRYSELFLKTGTAAVADEAINAQLLERGGFIDKTMAGVYTYLPLGLRVLNKIENIVREEMNTLGTELLMPALSPKSLWEETSRLNTIDVLMTASGGNELSRARNKTEYVLNSTHEELITPIARRMKMSYKDLPFAVYQIQTKFRNEERPKSGLLRGREFRMKDLYSFHATAEDLREYYERVQKVYSRVFDRLGLGTDTYLTLAGGGSFTNDYTHEFDTVCSNGEDTIYYDAAADTYYNAEVASAEIKTSGKSFKASEVGNIFPLGTKYADAFGYTYQDARGQARPVYMGSYGIGTSRTMGVLVEKFHDDKGIIWPKSVAPFDAYVIGIQREATAVVAALERVGKSVLYDDREEASPGQKFADADLLGLPVRLVVSAKTGDKVEIKRREEEETEVVTIPQLIERL